MTDYTVHTCKCGNRYARGEKNEQECGTCPPEPPKGMIVLHVLGINKPIYVRVSSICAFSARVTWIGGDLKYETDNGSYLQFEKYCEEVAESPEEIIKLMHEVK